MLKRAKYLKVWAKMYIQNLKTFCKRAGDCV